MSENPEAMRRKLRRLVADSGTGNACIACGIVFRSLYLTRFDEIRRDWSRTDKEDYCTDHSSVLLGRVIFIVIYLFTSIVKEPIFH